jgi:multimeric flavodoxin WrbA
MSRIEAADAVVRAVPVNFYNANAIFRRSIERLPRYVCWPWGYRRGPSPRSKTTDKVAVLVTSAAMPRFLIPIGTDAMRALKATARIIGAKPVAAYVSAFRGTSEAETFRPGWGESRADRVSWHAQRAPRIDFRPERCCWQL